MRVKTLIVRTHDGPLHCLEEGLEVGLFVPPILGEVGMFPQVHAKNRHTLNIDDAVHQRIVLVVGLSDQETAIVTDAEPDPPG